MPFQKTNPQYLYSHLQKRNLLHTPKAISEIKKYSEQHENVVLINPDTHTCKNNICLIGDDKQSYYRDDDHINAYGNLNIIKAIENYIH